MHKRCRDIRGRLKQDEEFKCRNCASQKTETVQEPADIELNGQYLHVVDKLGVVDSIFKNQK